MRVYKKTKYRLYIPGKVIMRLLEFGLEECGSLTPTKPSYYMHLQQALVNRMV